MKEALSVLEKAYQTFTHKGTDPPANSRLLWISTARMIVRFQNLRERVSEADHVAVLDENEEYVRIKFYSLLDSNRKNFTREYFCPGSDQYDGINIQRKSMAVIFGFSRWRENMVDPLDSIDDVEVFARGALPIDQFGAETYLEDFPDYWGKVQERRTALEAATKTNT